MININFKWDATGSFNMWDGFTRAIGDIDTIGQIMKNAASMVIVPHIAQRFTGQRVEQGAPSPTEWTKSNYKQDPVGPTADIASQPFSESGREEALFQAITDNAFIGEPQKTPYSVMLGIGNIDLLNKAAQIQQAKSGGTHHYLWMILEGGTGVHSKSFKAGDQVIGGSGETIIRLGTQAFFDRSGANPQLWEHVIVSKTENPGQVGRHFLFNLDGMLYESDKDSINWLRTYIMQQVRRFSK